MDCEDADQEKLRFCRREQPGESLCFGYRRFFSCLEKEGSQRTPSPRCNTVGGILCTGPHCTTCQGERNCEKSDKAPTWIPLKTCGVNWRPWTTPEDHQIWRSLGDSPKKNVLRFLRRRVWDLLQASTNNCMLSSSRNNTQLMVSIRALTILTLVVFAFCKIM